MKIASGLQNIQEVCKNCGWQNLLKTQFEQQSLGSCTCPAPCRNWWPISQLIRPHHSHQNHMKPPQQSAWPHEKFWRHPVGVVRFQTIDQFWARECLLIYQDGFRSSWKGERIQLILLSTYFCAICAVCKIERKTRTFQGSQCGLSETSLWSYPQSSLVSRRIPA